MRLVCSRSSIANRRERLPLLIFVWALPIMVLAGPRLWAQDPEPAFETLYSSAPADWRSEILPFPLKFAPDIQFSGREELRFAPGMFDPQKEDFFSYTFVWWLEGKVAVNQNMLRDNLLLYYRGLYQSLTESDEESLPPIGVEVNATREPAWMPGAQQNFRAKVDWVEAFVTKKPQTLHMMVAEWYCEDSDHTAVYFAVSPNPNAAELWQTMKGMRAGRCQ